MSNDAICCDVQLSPSSCCKPLSSSSPITSFSVFLFSFSIPFSPLLWFLEGSPFSLHGPTSFVYFGLFFYVSFFSHLLIFAFCKVQVIDLYKTTLHIVDMIIPFFKFVFSFPLINSFLL